MRNAAWASLIRMIPAEHHAKLMLVTTCGNEINLQTIARVEEDFMLIRARLAGTTDAPTYMFIPFEGINYFGFRVEVPEATVQGLFSGPGYVPPVAADSGPLSGEAEAVRQPAPSGHAPAPAAPPTPAAPPPAPMPTTPVGQPVLPGKAALLERLRKSRLGQQDPSKPG